MENLKGATDAALRAVTHPRFFATERGFHGRFYCALQAELDRRGVLRDDFILEMEYQKSGRHGASQRPDIVLHAPSEATGAPVTENNLAVWALKRRASPAEAAFDFCHLEEMFCGLHYPVGFFVNVDAQRALIEHYVGRFSDRVAAVAVWLEAGQVRTNWSP